LLWLVWRQGLTFGQAHLDHDLPILDFLSVARVTGMWYNIQLFPLLRGNLLNFFIQWSSQSQPPAQLGWQEQTTVPSCWLRWGGSYKRFAWAALKLWPPISASQLAKITDMSNLHLALILVYFYHPQRNPPTF
jgi:hypothetical protein